MLYLSSGCRDALGFTPEFVIQQGGTHFIADSFSDTDYSHVHSDMLDTDDPDADQACVYMMWLYIRNADDVPVLNRVVSFKCESCIVCVNTAYLDAPFKDHRELEVQALDGAMRRINVTKQRMARDEAERALAAQGKAPPRQNARSVYPRAAFVLENPTSIVIEACESGRRAEGPLIAFVSGSIGRIIDADMSDLNNYPFLKLVAPEDMLRVTEYIERLADSADVVFEKFSLLQRPKVIEGDVPVDDADNRRVVVESLGAAARDGIMLLLRRVGHRPAPQRDSVGEYARAKIHSGDAGYVSLAELVSSDCETTDVPESWSRLC
ncbi:hypothetical protein IWW55_002738 [Coemansia sp. RSA 2706]|nr:hypothetical protein IWW55_002738 [Coemansia sp. RSA 2706]KAJ2312354.1 hypothetical protein IWW54_002134 [Coemansia sp. RSA 2705]KAJ2326151.1 hypothetical protein IWW51_002423 [Coemansia sp. RSA 2702]